MPQAPGSENGESQRDSNENSLASNGSVDEPASHENGNGKVDGEAASAEDLPEEVPLRAKEPEEEDKPRIISTAERRKVILRRFWPAWCRFKIE